MTWLREEADPRVRGTVKQVVAERFAREAPSLHSLLAVLPRSFPNG